MDSSADSAHSTPSIRVELSVSPTKISLSSDDLPTIRLTATLSYSKPITLYSLHSVFNLNLALKRKNFTCQDLTTGQPLNLEITKGGKRPGTNFELGGYDDHLFHTLEPRMPRVFDAPFKVPLRPGFVQGHCYEMKIREGESVGPWWYGVREDVMCLAGEPIPDHRTIEGDKPIVLDSSQAITFEIIE